MIEEVGDKKEILSRRIRQARGQEPADLVVKNTTVFCLASGELLPGDVAVCGDAIVGIGACYEGKTELDGSGRTVVPGFIDSHVHIESSMITPYEYDRCVLPLGCTTVFCDPHELANVAGAAALDYFLASAEVMCLDLRVGLSSCVPSTHLETAGAALSVADLLPYRGRPQVYGLAEFMNVPGVLFQDPGVMAKLEAFSGLQIDGHSPLLGGRDLNAYLAVGARSCHESDSLAEAREKLNKGMQILIREGSVARNLDALAPLITLENSMSIGFCSDDRNPLDIAEVGHLNYMIRRAIELGRPPLAVYRAASWSAARAYGLRDRGLVAPGHRADLVLLSDLNSCRIEQVICGGKIVGDALFAARPPAPESEQFRGSIRLAPVGPERFRVFSKRARTPVIEIIPLSLITKKVELELPFDPVTGEKSADLRRNVAKVAVLERYGKNGNIGLGFVRGFGLTSGAIASSIGHDSHNICVVGASDADMAAAVNALIDTGGGFVVVRDGAVVDRLELPLGGLLSDRSLSEVEAKLNTIRPAARTTGCELEEPFLQLAFLPLPVIPFLRLTDRGLVDVEAFDFIEV